MTLTLYSKPGCCLCDEAKGYVARLQQRGYEIQLTEVDITTAPALFDRYRYLIPVIEGNGQSLEAPISEYRLEQLCNGIPIARAR